MMHTPRTRGFTLIETLVAIAILAIAVSGPLMTADRSIVAAESSRDELTASYLAQEGIEYVLAMRDDAYLAAYKVGGQNVSTTAWSNFISGGAATSIAGCVSSACTVDPSRTMGTGSNLALTACTGVSCTPLYLSGGIYTQSTASGATATPYTRTVQASAVSATEEQIVSKVTWSVHGVAHSITLTDHLTPWQ